MLLTDAENIPPHFLQDVKVLKRATSDEIEGLLNIYNFLSNKTLNTRKYVSQDI